MLSETSSSSSYNNSKVMTQRSELKRFFFQIKCFAKSEQADAERDKALRLKIYNAQSTTYMHIFNIGMCFSFKSHNFEIPTTICFFFSCYVFFFAFWGSPNSLWQRTKWLNLVSATGTVLNWLHLLCEFLYYFHLLCLFFWISFCELLWVIWQTDRLLLISSQLRSIFLSASHSAVVHTQLFFALLYHCVICLAHTCENNPFMEHFLLNISQKMESVCLFSGVTKFE